jgi:hypothetical protein
MKKKKGEGLQNREIYCIYPVHYPVTRSYRLPTSDGHSRCDQTDTDGGDSRPSFLRGVERISGLGSPLEAQRILPSLSKVRTSQA